MSKYTKPTLRNKIYQHFLKPFVCLSYHILPKISIIWDFAHFFFYFS